MQWPFLVVVPSVPQRKHQKFKINMWAFFTKAPLTNSPHTPQAYHTVHKIHTTKYTHKHHTRNTALATPHSQHHTHNTTLSTPHSQHRPHSTQETCTTLTNHLNQRLPWDEGMLRKTRTWTWLDALASHCRSASFSAAIVQLRRLTA